MKPFRLLPLLALFVPVNIAFAQSTPVMSAAVANTSVYSSLDAKVCKTLKTNGDDSTSEQICPGVAGYRLHVLDADGRMTLSVLGPDGGRQALNFMKTVTGSFSSLGPRAEWRMRATASGATPIALTVRLNAQEMRLNRRKPLRISWSRA